MKCFRAQCPKLLTKKQIDRGGTYCSSKCQRVDVKTRDYRRTHGA